MAYSTLSITPNGGSAFTFWVDPDSVNASYQNVIQVERSLGGTSYITSYASSAPGNIRTLTIGGAYLPSSGASILASMSSFKNSVTVTGGDVSGATLACLSGQYVVISVQTNPTKPWVDVGGEATVKYSYSITLQGID